MAHKRIKVRGVRRDEIDTEQYALVLWLMAKRQVDRKREVKEQDRKARREARDES